MKRRDDFIESEAARQVRLREAQMMREAMQEYGKCQSCGRLGVIIRTLGNLETLCPECSEQPMWPMLNEICRRCGAPLEEGYDVICMKCDYDDWHEEIPEVLPEMDFIDEWLTIEGAPAESDEEDDEQ